MIHRVLAGLLTVLALGGCSSVGLLYGQADRWVRWQADGYLNLSAEQDRWFAEQLREKKEWHRTSQLPRYSALLGRIADGLDGGEQLGPGVIQSLQQETDAMVSDVLRVIVPVGGELMMMLSDAQVEYFRGELNERNEELREKAAEGTAQERQRALSKRMLSGYKDFFGRLSDAQESVVLQAANDVVDDDIEQVRYREIWQGELLQLLAIRRENPICFLSQFYRMGTEHERWYTASYRASNERNERTYRELGIRIVALASPQQRARLAEKLRGYAESFDALASSGSTELHRVAELYRPPTHDACSNPPMAADG